MFLFDVHNDLLTQKKDIDFYLKHFKNEGVTQIILAIFLSEKKLNIGEIINLIKKVDSKQEIYFSIEDVSFLNYNDLNKLKQINPMYCSLTWNKENSLAGGAYSKKDITKLGYKYIDKIEEFSFVDTAHLNKKSFYSLAKYSKKPLLNSHTNLTKFHKHKRNLTHKQIKTIIKSNGLICLTGVKEFLGKNATIKTYINSIYYFYKKYGADNLALSTDFMGSCEFPLVYKNYRDFKLMYNLLRTMGISENDLKKIFYLNVIKFFNIKKNNKGEY